MEDQDHLSRRHRRALARQSKREVVKTSGFFRKIVIFVAIAVVILGVGYWMFNQGSKPLPGELVAEQGRDHVSDIVGVEYNSNPPTSGTHFPMWAKKGMYDRLISDGYLIHSMEHGYVIMWYDCTRPISNSQFTISSVYAHNEPTKESTDSGQLLKHMKLTQSAEMTSFTPENPPDVEVSLPEEFNSESCKNLQNDLKKVVNFKERVIVAPRVGMDTPVAVTSWGRVLKLESFDQAKLEEFISAFHNKGPETTVE